MAAIVAIMTAQNSRMTFGGFPTPVTHMEIEYDMESTVVTTNSVVKNKKTEDMMNPNDNCTAIAMIPLDTPHALNTRLTEPTVFNSQKTPDAPSTVNQKFVTIGAITATTKYISRIFLPLEILATNNDTKGPNPINHPKKKRIQFPSQTSSPRNVLILTKSVI